MKFGIEIFRDGYGSAIRIYQNGKDVSDLYRDEIQYVNQMIATVVSRYREMYRYQIMMSSTYGGGYIVEFDANQIRDIGFDGIDLVYSDLESLSIQFSDGLNGVIWDSIMKNAYYLPLVTKDSAKGLCDVLEEVAYVNDAMLGYYQDNQIDLVCGDLCKSGRYQFVAESFLDVVLNRHDIPDYYECSGIVFNYDNNTDIIEMFIPIEKLSTKMMASRVFNVGRFEGYYRDMLVECAERFKNTRYD